MSSPGCAVEFDGPRLQVRHVQRNDLKCCLTFFLGTGLSGQGGARMVGWMDAGTVYVFTTWFVVHSLSEGWHSEAFASNSRPRLCYQPVFAASHQGTSSNAGVASRERGDD